MTLRTPEEERRKRLESSTIVGGPLGMAERYARTGETTPALHAVTLIELGDHDSCLNELLTSQYKFIREAAAKRAAKIESRK